VVLSVFLTVFITSWIQSTTRKFTSEIEELADRLLNACTEQPERASHAYREWRQVFLSIFLLFLAQAQNY